MNSQSQGHSKEIQRYLNSVLCMLISDKGLNIIILIYGNKAAIITT